MTTPRIEIRLDRIQHNARTLVERLAGRGIGVTGVTKATLGSPEIAWELRRGGVTALGDSRLENLEALRAAGLPGPMVMIRSPMPSQASRVVEHTDLSFNTELDVLDRLSVAAEARHRRHGVILMVELGDLREGILPGDLEAVARATLRFPGIALRGIGTNLACQSGVTPDQRNMAELSTLASGLEGRLDIDLAQVSGGNSANLDWVFSGAEVGRINDLRLGESILLGCEPLRRQPIAGLHTDAFTLVAEVIESKTKPTHAWGDISQTAFGHRDPTPDRGDRGRAILAIGRQDVDPDGLTPPAGMQILGASSDHLIVDPDGVAAGVGTEVRFGLDYSALLRAMTSPFVERVFIGGTDAAEADPGQVGSSGPD